MQIVNIYLNSIIVNIAEIGVIVAICISISIMLVTLIGFFRRNAEKLDHLGSDSNFLESNLSSCMGYLFILFSVFCAGIIAWIYMYQ